MTLDKKEQLLRQIDAGDYLSSLRNKKGLSITAVAKELSVSRPYLSEIEKGIRLPSDELIRKLAEYYDVDEDDLFKRYGKVPLLARHHFKGMTGLHKVLSDASKLDITDEQRQRFSDLVTKLYADFLKEITNDDNSK